MKSPSRGLTSQYATRKRVQPREAAQDHATARHIQRYSAAAEPIDIYSRHPCASQNTRHSHRLSEEPATTEPQELCPSKATHIHIEVEYITKRITSI